jgi:hypothetical protein
MYNIKPEKIYQSLTKQNIQISDDEDNYSAEDLNNNSDYDDYFDDYISDYDDYFDDYDQYDTYYSEKLKKSNDYRSLDYGYLEDLDKSSFYDYFQ